MGKKIRVLLVEDSADDAELLLLELRRGGYEPEYERVESREDMLAAIGSRTWDMIISDYRLPRFSAPQALEVLKESGQDLPFIIVSGKISEDLLVEAMRAGAHDYLIKENLSRLAPAIDRELREAAERATRRNAVRAIQQGKMEWEAAFDAVSDLVILTDESGVVIRCNRRVIEYFNAGYRDILGRKITEIFYGTARPEVNHFDPAQPPLLGFGEDVHFPSIKGWFNVAHYPLHPSAESSYGHVYVIVDVTKRKRMEEEKRITERELLTLYAIASRLNSRRGAAKVMSDLLYQLHHVLEIEFSTIYILDSGVLELMAWRGLSGEFVAQAKNLPVDLTWISTVLAGGTFQADGAEGHFSPDIVSVADTMGLRGWCAFPLKVGTGVIGMLIIAHKTEKVCSDREIFLLTSIANQMAVLIENHILYDRMKEKNEELKRSRKALKENLEDVKRANIELGRLNTAKNSFIGMASHELKTPLTSIIGGLQFLHLYSNLQMSDDQREIMASVYEGVLQLKSLVDDLLSVSRLEAKGVEPQKRWVRPLAIAREVHATFALPLSERNIEVIIGDNDSSILADEGLFRSVVRNLLENAIKFTRDGGSVSILGRSVTREEALQEESLIRPFYPDFPANLPASPAYYRMDIIDSGIGIPPAERVRIFEKFYSIGDIAYHSSGKTGFMSKGSGLGLSIVKGVVDAHQGLVWIASGPDGVGSRFSLLFPME